MINKLQITCLPQTQHEKILKLTQFQQTVLATWTVSRLSVKIFHITRSQHYYLWFLATIAYLQQIKVRSHAQLNAVCGAWCPSRGMTHAVKTHL